MEPPGLGNMEKQLQVQALLALNFLLIHISLCELRIFSRTFGHQKMLLNLLPPTFQEMILKQIQFSPSSTLFYNLNSLIYPPYNSGVEGRKAGGRDQARGDKNCPRRDPRHPRKPGKCHNSRGDHHHEGGEGEDEGGCPLEAGA